MSFLTYLYAYEVYLCPLRQYILCVRFNIADGTLGDKRARLFELDITETKLAGNINTQMESEASEPRDYDAAMKGFFEFVQTEDGSVPVTRHSREELQEIVNIKKAIASCFQANFMGTETKEEDDTQSRHTSHYTYV